MSVRPSDRVGKPTSKRLILTNCYTRTQVGITSIRSDPIRYTRRCKKWQEKTTKKDWPIISIIISSSSFSFRWWLWYYYCQWWGRGGPWTDLGPLAVNTIVKLFNLNSLKLLRMIDEANLAAVISTVFGYATHQSSNCHNCYLPVWLMASLSGEGGILLRTTLTYCIFILYVGGCVPPYPHMYIRHTLFALLV